MKTAIVYYSKHHGNTKKLLDEIALKHEVDLIDVTQTPSPDLSGYERVGFASGIYYSKFQKLVLKCAGENLPNGKEVFFIYTYGAKKSGYTNAITQEVNKHGAKILGEYGCFGFNTFGPFKLIGGMAKGHPTAEELSGVETFYAGL